jgi:uncharacterized protein
LGKYTIICEDWRAHRLAGNIGPWPATYQGDTPAMAGTKRPAHKYCANVSFFLCLKARAIWEATPHKEKVALTKSRNEQLIDRLRDLQTASADIEAAAIVSIDGLSIASAMPKDYGEDRVSAMSAAMLALGERIAGELGRGMLDTVYVKGQHGYVILMSIGEDAVLTVLAREQAKLGLIFLDMSRAVKELTKLLVG